LVKYTGAKLFWALGQKHTLINVELNIVNQYKTDKIGVMIIFSW